MHVCLFFLLGTVNFLGRNKLKRQGESSNYIHRKRAYNDTREMIQLINIEKKTWKKFIEFTYLAKIN